MLLSQQIRWQKVREREMTTTEIYYNKGYEKGRKDMLMQVLSTVDEVTEMIGKINPNYPLAWNKGFDDGVKTFCAAIMQTLRKDMLGGKSE
jgi:hypothetical protein